MVVGICIWKIFLFQAPEEMKYPSKRLYSYNIRSGDEIIIDCKKKLNDSK